MSSGKGIANFPGAGTTDPSFKGKNIAAAVSDMNLNSAEDEGWEEIGKKSKNKNRSNPTKQWGGPQNPNPKVAWGGHGGPGRGSSGQTGPVKHGGRGYTKPQVTNRGPDYGYIAANPVIPPPLKNGWGWSTRPGSTQPSEEKAPTVDLADEVDDGGDDDEESEDDIDDSDDELLSDGFDSDESQKSHETRKSNKWFKELFQSLDVLTVEQINEAGREWHCPACKGGPGAIDWYQGLQPLISHAKTKRSKRVKLHRELAELLEEELRRRGTSAIPSGETFGMWKGLGERADKEIVWPPMVIIMNTRHEKDENEKWIGMGNQELLDYFHTYAATKARHSYGPQGHRGMSVLIFEASAVGYVEAERLSKHFEDTCRDRLAWARNRVPIYSGGKRQLYGYIAEKQDMDNFNQHSQGKSKLKYEMRSYQEMVVKQMKQMSEENQQLTYLKHKVAKEQKSKKALEEVYGIMAERYQKTVVENRKVMLSTKEHQKQNKAEMEYQTKFFEEQMEQIYESRNAKEENFQKIQQHERDKVTSSEEDRLRRGEDVAKLIQLQEKEMEEFVNKRDELIKAHEERKMDLKRRHWDEMVALEKKFDEEFDKLMEKYTPTNSN